MNITVNNNTAGIITEQNKTNVYTEKQTYTVTGTSNTANTTANQQKAIVSNGGKIVYESDHSKLTNRDKVDQHPISAITGLEEALKNAGTGSGGEGKVKDVLVDGTSVLDENGNANINGLVKEESFNKTINEFEQAAENLDSRMGNLEEAGEYILKELGNKAGKNEIPSLDGYATEKWVEDKKYMPIPDFQEYMNYAYYDKTQVYNKEEIDTKLEELPTGAELYGGDNTVIEDSKINVYTNTGYKVSDKDIQLQSITDSGTTGVNKIIYIEDKEIMVIYDGSNKIRYSENGIDFEVITLPYACKSMVYNKNSKRIFGLANGYFIYSDDYGKTWEVKQSTFANNVDYISLGQGHVNGFITVNKSTKRMYSLNEDFAQSGSYITSTISPDFITQFAQTQHIWCNSAGTFKYGAGSKEGVFASISGVTVNMLKTVNSRQYVGLKNSNKLYIIKNLSGTSGNEWIPYTLPDICTVNDIIYNPYDETYYIFTTVNTYYKTKDFITFESVDKNSFRGIQGYFTLMGIQMTTLNHNELLLAPTRTKLENKAQEWDRLADKTLWVNKGLELTEDGKVNVKSNTDIIVVTDNGLFLGNIDQNHLTEDILESLYVAKAELKDNFDPYEFDSWYWEFGIPAEDMYKATKVIFNQAGSFYNQVTWEEEYIVEQYEYGYVFCDINMSIFKYVKLGNLSWFFQ